MPLHLILIYHTVSQTSILYASFLRNTLLQSDKSANKSGALSDYVHLLRKLLPPADRLHHRLLLIMYSYFLDSAIDVIAVLTCLGYPLL